MFRGREWLAHWQRKLRYRTASVL